MTDQPKTLSLDPNEWKALLLNNIERAHKAVNESGGISPDGLSMLNDHFDRIKGIAAAWHASQPPVPVVENNEPKATQAPTNGAQSAPAKKRGGWPKGKKRNASAQAVQ